MVDGLNVNGETVSSSKSIGYLGAILDQELNMKRFIGKKARTASFHLQSIKQVRKYLTLEACKIIVQALVISHLDYANAILAGLPKCSINRLQRIQNAAARVVLQRSRDTSGLKCCRQLHWLPIPQRIDYKILTLAQKALHGTAPQCLCSMLSIKQDSHYHLRSANTRLLEVPNTKCKTFASRAFSVYAPTRWNNWNMLPT